MAITRQSVRDMLRRFDKEYRIARDSTRVLAPRLCQRFDADHNGVVLGVSERYRRVGYWRESSPDDPHERALPVTCRSSEFCADVTAREVSSPPGILEMQLSNLGQMVKRRPDLLLRDSMQSADKRVGPAGVPYFSDDHLHWSCGKFSNLSRGRLTASAYRTLVESMSTRRMASDDEHGVKPNLLTIPPQLEGHAKALLSELPAIERPEVLVLDVLSNEPGTWYVFSTNTGLMPLVHVVRRDPEFGLVFCWDEDMDQYIDEHLADWNAYDGPSDFQCESRHEIRFGVRVVDQIEFTSPLLGHKVMAE